MTAVVYSVMGDLILAPTTATVGGTALPGLDSKRPIRLIAPHGLQTERNGFARDAVRSFVLPADEPFQLILPAAGHDANTLKLLFATHTSNGTTIQSAGGNALKAARTCRETTAIIRPASTSEFYWYFPRLQLFEESIPLMNRSMVDFAGIDDSLLVLLCGKPDGGLLDAAFIGSAADINSTYNLGSGTPLIVLSAPYVDLGTAASGVAGTPVSYTVEGYFLAGNISVPAVTGIQYSVTGAAGAYADTQALVPVNGRVTQTVWVRFKTTASVGAFLQSIAHTSSGAVTKNLVAAGTVTA